MQIFPAIDLKNGQCVRLFQGDFSKKTVVNEDQLPKQKHLLQTAQPICISSTSTVH